MNYSVGDIVNGYLKTFDNMQDAQNYLDECIKDGNLSNKFHDGEYIGTNDIGEDVYKEYKDCSTFYYITEDR